MAAAGRHVAVGFTGWLGAAPHPADPCRCWAQPITQALGLCSCHLRALLWESIGKARVPQPGKPREMHLFPPNTQAWINKDRYSWGPSSEVMLLLRNLSSAGTQETALGPLVYLQHCSKTIEHTLRSCPYPFANLPSKFLILTEEVLARPQKRPIGMQV